MQFSDYIVDAEDYFFHRYGNLISAIFNSFAAWGGGRGGNTQEEETRPLLLPTHY